MRRKMNKSSQANGVLQANLGINDGDCYRLLHDPKISISGKNILIVRKNTILLRTITIKLIYSNL